MLTLSARFSGDSLTHNILGHAGLFIAVWAVALTYWRWGNVEAKWSANVPAGAAPSQKPAAES